ncbi:MAG: hypothetical protein KGN00_07095 [Chloroflexota bacterium]|nr:hypothetical protein [Chloroflexota bacterium]
MRSGLGWTRRKLFTAPLGFAAAFLVSACLPDTTARAPARTPAAEAAGADGGTPPSEVHFSGTGETELGTWSTDVVASPTAWTRGSTVHVRAALALSDAHLEKLSAKARVDGFVALVTAERTFDADGRLRLPSDERMSTLLTVTSLPIEGGRQGAVSRLVGHAFRTPIDEMLVVPLAAAKSAGGKREVTFDLSAALPPDLPPGLYRLRIDYGVRAARRELNLYAGPFAERPFTNDRSEIYSPVVEASGTHANGRAVDASTIVPRVPWVLLAPYNSNGYRGVVAEEDAADFALSSRNLIQDDVILPLYDEADPKKARTYSLEPVFPADAISQSQNIAWDPTAGELRVRVTQPDGRVVDLGTSPFVARSAGLTTKNAKLTQWRPPMYGPYAVEATGWMKDVSGRRYEGGGTYRFWIAKRMTLATATFQGQAYPVGDHYGRDMGFSPAVPADVSVTATLYADSDRAKAKTVTCSGKASSGGLFTAAQGLKPLPFDAPGEYAAHVLATYTDPDGHLWVSTMRHAGVVYAADAAIVAHGKKLRADGRLVDRGETHLEGWVDAATDEPHLEHVNFPYNSGDALLIAAEGQGANKIEPVLTWSAGDGAYDPALQPIGATNVRLETSNGYSPHLFPEYITDRLYYYASAARPGFMGRFLVADDGTRAPYWPTTRTDFGGQINASPNGDAPGTIYRLMGAVVLLRKGVAPAYAGYLANAFILPKGSNDNRVIEPGSEDLVSSTRERARFFLAMNARPGMVYEAGTTFVPAFQLDPIVPANMRFTLHYPDGRDVVAAGVAKAGSWVGKEPWILDAPGLYRYTVAADWNGHAGIVPGIPADGGEMYVVEKDRPSGAKGIAFDLAPVSAVDPVKGATFRGMSSASEVAYAMITPGAVLEQGTLPVTKGSFSFRLDPAALYERAQTFEVKNARSGKPELSNVVHLTFFARETSPAPFHSFVRLIVRGNRVHYTR